MLNAKEAHNKTVEALRKYSDEELKKILELIKLESEKGYYHISTGLLCSFTIESLKNLGYEVINRSDYIPGCNIWWDNKKESWLDKWIKKLKDSKN